MIYDMPLSVTVLRVLRDLYCKVYPMTVTQNQDVFETETQPVCYVSLRFPI